MTRVTAALSGDLRRFMREEHRKIERAMTGGVTAAAAGLKADLRGQVTGAGLGRRLANAWRSKVYPEAGQSARAAAQVWTKAPELIRVFDQGALIRSRSGFWLAIPTDDAPKRGIGGKRISPSNFPESRFGPLRLVYRPGRVSMLVVDGVRRNAKTGRIGRQAKNAGVLKSGRFAKGVQTVPMFWLVPQVRLRKRLDTGPVARGWQSRLPSLIDREFDRLDAQAAAR